MVGIIRKDDSFYAYMENRVLFDIRMSRSSTVDIFPCCWADKGKLVRRSADYITVVFLMQISEPMREVTLPGGHGDWNFGGSGQFWAWEL